MYTKTYSAFPMAFLIQKKLFLENLSKPDFFALHQSTLDWNVQGPILTFWPEEGEKKGNSCTLDSKGHFVTSLFT